MLFQSAAKNDKVKNGKKRENMQGCFTHAHLFQTFPHKMNLWLAVLVPSGNVVLHILFAFCNIYDSQEFA